jgi:hypothetical protein
MTLKKVQILPETLNLDPERFKLSRARVTDEALQQSISTAFLAKNWLSIISRSADKPIILFNGDFAAEIRGSLLEISNLDSEFKIENRVQNKTNIQIISPITFFVFDPIKKSSIRSEGDLQYQYYFEIEIF